jgi:hypothetical protein
MFFYVIHTTGVPFLQMRFHDHEEMKDYWWEFQLLSPWYLPGSFSADILTTDKKNVQ